MTNKDLTIAKLRAETSRLSKELAELRKARVPEITESSGTAAAREYITDLQVQVKTIEKRVADLRTICRTDSIKQWDAMATEVAKANKERDAWKQIAEAGIAHIHIAVARARAEAREAASRLIKVRLGANRIENGVASSFITKAKWGDTELGSLVDKDGNHRPGCVCPLCLPIREKL